MLSFKHFIIESDDGKLKHLTHLEDHVIDNREEGVDHAIAHLYSVHDKLKGRRLHRATTTVKQDGAPAVIFGTHPKTGKFFVGTKSVFNKTPKINYTQEDIQANHGHAPGLVEKLGHALKHLPKITPRGKIYQGDMMHSKGDVKTKGNKVSFKPNTIEYSIDKHSAEGKKALNSHMGISVHTEYKPNHAGADLADHSAHFNPDMSKFKQHKDVHLISHHYDFDDPNYEQHHQAGFKQHMNAAKKAAGKISSKDFDVSHKHAPLINVYINKKVRESGDDPMHPGLGLSGHDFRSFLKNRAETHSSKKERMTAAAAHQELDGHEKSLDKVFELHHHITRAKENLIGVLDRRQAMHHSINGVQTSPEGYVNSIKGNPVKLVRRTDFSKANFQTGRPGS